MLSQGTEFKGITLSSDTASTHCTDFTPATELTDFDGSLDDPTDQIPWPGDAFVILERSSGKAITLRNGQVVLEAYASGHEGSKRWLCVEQDNYFGFYNSMAGVYLGHDGDLNMRATAKALRGWEMFTARRHPKGGYQLLIPFYSDKLMLLTVKGDGKSLSRSMHGETLWEFVKVQ